jgi:hypothetical protein
LQPRSFARRPEVSAPAWIRSKFIGKPRCSTGDAEGDTNVVRRATKSVSYFIDDRRHDPHPRHSINWHNRVVGLKRKQ